MFCNVLRFSMFVLVLIPFLPGCQMISAPDSEAAAESYLDSEMSKWIAGSRSEATTIESPIEALSAPIGYSIKSCVRDKPHFMAAAQGSGMPADWESWTAYKINVAIEFRSKAGSPMQKIATYTLTWNPVQQRWYLHQRV